VNSIRKFFKETPEFIVLFDFQICDKKVAILNALWTKSTLWTVPIVVWCSKLKKIAPGGGCPVLALFPILFDGLVVPLWDKWTCSAGQRPVHCPTLSHLILSHLIWRPPYPSPILSHPIWRTPCLCPTCPTYSNLSQSVPFGCTTCPFPTPFAQIFFLGFSLSSHIWKNTFDWNVCFISSTYYHVRDGQ